MSIPADQATSDRIYDGLAKVYGFDIESTLAARLKYDLVRRNCTKDARLLDVGCSNGLFMRALAAQCRHIDGIDINDLMLEQARLKFTEDGVTNAAVYKQSATALEFEDNVFDVTFSFSLLLLVPRPLDAIDQMIRVTKPGGVLILDITGRYNLSQLYWGHFYKRNGHGGVVSYSYRQIAGALEARGLTIIERHGLGLTDQWKYIPVLRWLQRLEGYFHNGQGDSGAGTDLDYRLSNHSALIGLANRWYLVCRKAG